MKGFLVRLGITAFSLWLASAIVPGMTIEGVGTILLAAFLLGFVNAIVRPLVILLTLPATILTLGLWLLVINAAMLGLVAKLLDGFRLDGFWPALLGSILVSIMSGFASWYVGSSGTVVVLGKVDRSS